MDTTNHEPALVTVSSVGSHKICGAPGCLLRARLNLSYMDKVGNPILQVTFCFAHANVVLNLMDGLKVFYNS